MVSQQEVLSASGVYSSNGLPFVPAPQSERAPPSPMGFPPAPTTERMGANAVQPPVQAASQGFASPGFGSAGGTTPPEPVRAPLPSLAGAPAAPGAPPAASGWDGAAESPWATTSARLERPELPSNLAPDRAEPSRPAAPTAARRDASSREGGSRTLVLVLSVILAIALLSLIGISVWQSMRGRDPISIDYTEPLPTTAEVEPAAPAIVTAAPSATAPRPVVRPRPKNDDVYEEAEREIDRR